MKFSWTSDWCRPVWQDSNSHVHLVALILSARWLSLLQPDCLTPHLPHSPHSRHPLPCFFFPRVHPPSLPAKGGHFPVLATHWNSFPEFRSPNFVWVSVAQGAVLHSLRLQLTLVHVCFTAGCRLSQSWWPSSISPVFLGILFLLPSLLSTPVLHFPNSWSHQSATVGRLNVSAPFPNYNCGLWTQK